MISLVTLTYITYFPEFLRTSGNLKTFCVYNNALKHSYKASKRLHLIFTCIYQALQVSTYFSWLSLPTYHSLLHVAVSSQSLSMSKTALHGIEIACFFFFQNITNRGRYYLLVELPEPFVDEDRFMDVSEEGQGRRRRYTLRGPVSVAPSGVQPRQHRHCR